MMTLLCDEYNRCIVLLDKDIDIIYTKLQRFRDLPMFREHEERIKAHLDQVTQENLAVKDKKFWREKRAFQEGEAYKWHQTNKPQRQHNRGSRTGVKRFRI